MDERVFHPVEKTHLRTLLRFGKLLSDHDAEIYFSEAGQQLKCSLSKELLHRTRVSVNGLVAQYVDSLGLDLSVHPAREDESMLILGDAEHLKVLKRYFEWFALPKRIATVLREHDASLSMAKGKLFLSREPIIDSERAEEDVRASLEGNIARVVGLPALDLRWEGRQFGGEFSGDQKLLLRILAEFKRQEKKASDLRGV